MYDYIQVFIHAPKLKKMKLLLLPILSSVCLLPVNNPLKTAEKPVLAAVHLTNTENIKEASEITFQAEPGYGKLSSVVFKNQDYCRAELKDFEFDAKFIVVSATVYFSGAPYKGVERGYINSNSLKPIKKLMERCLPGTVVVFDDVKVKGPDNEVRQIEGLTLSLY